ncbi:MAG TPA: UDP-3-O-acyl-N-acetylglucosamine deacetylase [Gemmatimonadaceae bacterium]|nr:UDP-3-O-acyl-N-acetylglucosamine deacetylase [Gemmatimonadaceae bacterium]
MSEVRRTIARPVSLTGVGLHLGHRCRLTFEPAAPSAGIGFRRSDRPSASRIPALAERAVLTERRTQLGEGDEAVHTVEHVLSAAAGMGIDDLTIAMDAPEPPILDGSAAPFVEALERAGLIGHDGMPGYLDVHEPITVVDGDSVYEAHPAPSLELEVMIDFPHPLIGEQAGRWVVTPELYARELAPARTFGFVHEVEMLRAKGLIRGASVDNAVVLDAAGVVGNRLRWPDEFVRHKAMDCVGDLALAGRRVRARVVAVRPSHRGTVLLVRELSAALARR